MLAIALLTSLACAGILYSLWLLPRERAQQTAAPLPEPGTGWADPVTEEPQPSRRLRRLMPGTLMDSYEERLRLAGRPWGLEADQMISLKLVGALLLPALISVVALFRIGSGTAAVMFLTAMMGFLLPDLWLTIRLEARRRLVQEELPLFAELIAASVSAGLSLTEAVRRVASDAPGLVAREFLRAVQEMAAGKPRTQAWRDLMDRLPGDELMMIVTAIMQAEQYGTSVADVIRYQIGQIRSFKQQEAQRIAQAATVKMRIPMLLLILVPFMVILLSPAMLQLRQLLR